MYKTALTRFDILTKLSRYEAAYKQSVRFAQAQMSSEGNLVQLNSPLLDLVRHYKQLIKQTRAQLIRSIND